VFTQPAATRSSRTGSSRCCSSRCAFPFDEVAGRWTVRDHEALARPLADTEFVVVDLETTGGAPGPKRDHRDRRRPRARRASRTTRSRRS
jgi:hypothetical protein